jgi:hypothetical protein
LLIEFKEWKQGCLTCGSYTKEIQSWGAVMDAKFDIFKKLPDGHPLWVKAVVGLEEAKKQLARLAANSPDEYFIYCVHNGRVVERRMAAGA